MNLFSLKNMIKEPTFTSIHGSSLLDVALTNVRMKFGPSSIIDTGISDGHSMIIAVTKTKLPKQAPRVINYRSYKTFNKESFIKDMEHIPFNVCMTFDDPGDILWAQEQLIKELK